MTLPLSLQLIILSSLSLFFFFALLNRRPQWCKCSKIQRSFPSSSNWSVWATPACRCSSVCSATSTGCCSAARQTRAFSWRCRIGSHGSLRYVSVAVCLCVNVYGYKWSACAQWLPAQRDERKRVLGTVSLWFLALFKCVSVSGRWWEAGGGIVAFIWRLAPLASIHECLCFVSDGRYGHKCVYVHVRLP